MAASVQNTFNPLVVCAIVNGTLRSITQIQRIDVSTIYECFVSQIDNNTINKTEGWEYRVLSNYIYVLGRIKKLLDDWKNVEIKNKVKAYLSGQTFFNLPSVDVVDTVFDAAISAKNGYFTSQPLELTPTQELRHICLCVFSDYKIQLRVYNSMLQLFNLYPAPDNYIQELDILLDQYHNLIPQKITSSILQALITRVRQIYDVEHYFSAKVKTIRKVFNEIVLTQEQLQNIIETMPRVYEIPLKLTIQQYFQLSPQAKIISRLPHSIAAYTLGFPIQNGIPGDAQITAALFKLSRDGPQEYMVSVGRKWDALIRYETEGLTWSTNDEDAITMIPYRHFGPFDRIIYVEDDHAFEFTRSSWKDLVNGVRTGSFEEDGDNVPINPFTRKPLSKAFLEQLKARIAIAELYNLPESDTLDSLIENAKNYGKKRESSGGGSNPNLAVSNLFNSMFGMFGHPQISYFSFSS